MKEMNNKSLIVSVFKNMLKIKNPDELLEAARKTNLKKTLNWFDLIILGIGAIIGAGIFAMVGSAVVGGAGLPGAGPGVVISMLIAAVACIFSALCYAEFASMIPAAGGVYTYTYATMGEFAAWVMGWIMVMQYCICNITVACSWTDYFFKLLHGFEGYVAYLPSKLQPVAHHLMHPPLWLINDYASAVHKYQAMGLNPTEHIPVIFNIIPFSLNLPAMFMILLVTLILIKGMSESKTTAAIMVAVKVAVITIFIVLGAFYVEPANWTPFAPNGASGIVAGAFIIFFAYIGFDAISTAAEETKNPQRDVPIGIIASLVVCTIIYILVALVLTGMTNDVDVMAPIAAAMANVGQNWTAGFISLGALTGLTSVLLVMQLATTRIMFAMSRDNFFPAVFKKVHPKFRTPHVITLATGLLIIVGSLFMDLTTAAGISNLGVFTSFIIVCLGVIILRKTDPDRPRPFRVPFVPLFPVLGMLICGGLMVYACMNMGPVALMYPAWIILGIGIYFAYGYRKNRRIEALAAEEASAAEQEEELVTATTAKQKKPKK